MIEKYGLQRLRDHLDAKAPSTERLASKRELREMLAEAVRNTAKLPINNGDKHASDY